MASLGGFVKQYQVAVDPNKLLAYNIPITDVMMAIKQANLDVGGGAIEIGETEFVVRSHGYIRSLEDLSNIVVMSTQGGDADPGARSGRGAARPGDAPRRRRARTAKGRRSAASSSCASARTP